MEFPSSSRSPREFATLQGLEDALPNGLHDASLLGISVDYISRQATLLVAVDVSTPGEQQPRERRVRISLFGVSRFSLDLPASLSGASLWISGAGPGHPDGGGEQPPPGCFNHWLFIDPWNAFIRVCAESCTLEDA